MIRISLISNELGLFNDDEFIETQRYPEEEEEKEEEIGKENQKQSDNENERKEQAKNSPHQPAQLIDSIVN